MWSPTECTLWLANDDAEELYRYLKNRGVGCSIGADKLNWNRSVITYDDNPSRTVYRMIDQWLDRKRYGDET